MSCGTWCLGAPAGAPQTQEPGWPISKHDSKASTWRQQQQQGQQQDCRSSRTAAAAALRGGRGSGRMHVAVASSPPAVVRDRLFEPCALRVSVKKPCPLLVLMHAPAADTQHPMHSDAAEGCSPAACCVSCRPVRLHMGAATCIGHSSWSMQLTQSYQQLQHALVDSLLLQTTVLTRTQLNKHAI